MKPLRVLPGSCSFTLPIIATSCLLLPMLLGASPATVLFEDDFNGGIPGWTAVQPAGVTYTDGPMLWQFDKVSNAFSEQSNIYTGPAAGSTTRVAVMLLNDTVAPADFTYTATLTGGDNDGFGLIFGYQDPTNFYRVTIGNEARSAWPFQGWGVEQMTNGQPVDLFGGPAQIAYFVNTIGQPFDVTIRVLAGKLTLTVVDYPSGFPTPYELVVDEPLPAPAGGRVGMFSWGMSGSALLRSFRVQNPVLSPTPLTGDPVNTVLTNWSFLITPRADGSTNMNSVAAPLWSYGLSLNGDRGTMIENSDNFLNADNTVNGTTNFAAPSAVAGDVNWSNYVYSARFISSDDDGYGMLLRFTDESNFYRIGFRAQNSLMGVRRGISIQKNVNLEFDEIFSNTNWVPPIATPMDVHAAISTNRLQVMVTVNPDGLAPVTSLFGPFDITGPTVDNGKVGIFSWAQLTGGTTSDAGTEVDFVRVREVNGQGLFVASAYGTPDPPVGLNDLPPGSVTAQVDSPVAISPGIRQVVTGWSGLGSVPASGTANSVNFELVSLSSLTWNWATEYLLSTSANAGGTVSASFGPWVPAGSNITVTATANPGFIFAGWSGDRASINPNLAFVMNRPLTLTASFSADTDGDGLADAWETAYFGDLSQPANGDPDADGATNLEEFLRGTNPTSAEALIASDGLSSQWINTQRDPALPGMLRVVDFGSGFRGAFDDSNDNRFGNDINFISADDVADFASFQSPRVVVKSELWTNDWSTNFSATAEISVGDNDGNCFYFRYRDEQNWYRVTLCGEDTPANLARPLIGLSVQSRVDGKYALLQHMDLGGPASSAITDPLDGWGIPAGYKRVRLAVNATNDVFEVRVTPWSYLVPGFEENLTYAVTFTDASHAAGRIGFGFWGQGGFGNMNETNGIPIAFGAFIDNISVRSPAEGAVVFSEDWESASLSNAFPVGWSNPFSGTPGLEGTWWVTAHGTIVEQSNSGPQTTGTLVEPRADADGPILLAPDQESANYLLEIGIHPFDNDGIGFVYDFQDTNNYSRVLFRQETTFNGAVPPGLSVSRKSGGAWTDILAADATFLYTPGRPFAVQFANNNGNYRLQVRELDNPANTFNWQWAAPAAAPSNRFGLATWASTDAHFTHARAYSLPASAPAPELEITGVTVSGGNIVLTVRKPEGSTYDVLRAPAVEGEYEPVATAQSAAQYSEPLPTATTFYRLRLTP